MLSLTSLSRCHHCNHMVYRVYQPLSIIERTFFFKRKPKDEPKDESLTQTDSLMMENAPKQLTDDEIMKIRDKSRIPKKIRDYYGQENMEPPKYLWQFRKSSIRRMYAHYGRASGLKPGICWPVNDELQHIIGYDNAFRPTLTQMMQNAEEKKQTILIEKMRREKEIMENLKKLPEMKEQFYRKYHQMHADAEMEKIKKEKLIQDVREFLGYDVNPKDPRFQEALLKKEEEEKKAAKGVKKQDKAAYAMAKLAALAEEAMEREKKEAEQEMRRKSMAKDRKREGDEGRPQTNPEITNQITENTNDIIEKSTEKPND